MSFDTQIQKAVYSELSQNADLMRLIEGVYDFVDQNSKYPYVAIGEASDTEYDTFYEVGRNVLFSVHVWTEERGTKKAQQILNEIYTTLNRVKLEGSSDINFITCQYESGDMFREDGGLVWHGVQQYRILVEEI